jgi:hypothetical protein
MVSKNKGLEAFISSVNLCACLARATTRPHIDITNVCKKGHHHQFWKKLTNKQIKFPFFYKDILVYLLSEEVFHPFDCLPHDIV